VGAAQIIEKLRSEDVSLSLTSVKNIKVRRREGEMDPSLRVLIRSNKSLLVKHLLSISKKKEKGIDMALFSLLQMRIGY
jgi:acetate kinase